MGSVPFAHPLVFLTILDEVAAFCLHILRIYFLHQTNVAPIITVVSVHNVAGTGMGIAVIDALEPQLLIIPCLVQNVYVGMEGMRCHIQMFAHNAGTRSIHGVQAGPSVGTGRTGNGVEHKGLAVHAVDRVFIVVHTCSAVPPAHSVFSHINNLGLEEFPSRVGHHLVRRAVKEHIFTLVVRVFGKIMALLF